MKRLVAVCILVFLILRGISFLLFKGDSNNKQSNSEINESDVTVTSVEKTEEEIVLPIAYSSIEDGCVTEVKAQQRGDCWAYACATTIDINNQKLKGERLLYPSDDIVINCNSDRWTEGRILPDYMDEFEWGGTTYDTGRLFVYGYDGHILKNMNIYEDTSIEEIKKAVMKYGALQIGVGDNCYYGSDGYCNLYADENSLADHSVVIIGWDDTYSKEMFHDKPENDGAWLAQNSHGEKWSKGGFYWISFDSKLYEVSCFELEELDAEVLGYADATFLTVSTGDTTTGASVFDYEGTLKAVGVYTTEQDTNVRVDIYDKNFSKIMYTEEVFFKDKGYHLVELSIPQEVTSCAIAVTVDKSFTLEGPEVESVTEPYIAECNPGESYMLIDDEWVDMSSSDIKERLNITEEPNNCFITAVYVREN